MRWVELPVLVTANEETFELPFAFNPKQIAMVRPSAFPRHPPSKETEIFLANVPEEHARLRVPCDYYTVMALLTAMDDARYRDHESPNIARLSEKRMALPLPDPLPPVTRHRPTLTPPAP